MLTRLRWSAFGLRGRIVGAVLITTAVTLVVAGLVLLPRLEDVLRNGSTAALKLEVKNARKYHELSRLASIQYPLIANERSPHPSVRRHACNVNRDLYETTQRIAGSFGGDVSLIGMIGARGTGGVLVTPSVPKQCSGSIATDLGEYNDLRGYVGKAVRNHKDQYQFTSNQNNPFVEAVIWVSPSSVLAVRTSIAAIPTLEAAVGRAFEIAAGAAVLVTLLVAIPLAGTLVGRLRRLRQAALQIAIDGSDRARFPVDRARDEVGDLSRSFSIMQRRLRQQEEARRAFVATASHELRTPLASLDGMLELLADDLQADGTLADPVDMREAAALLDRARAQSRRLGRLAADLLDLSRLDAEVALRSEPVELGELARAVLAEFELASLDRGATVVLNDDPSPVWALADPGSVARILRILLDNALRVAPRGSEVAVSMAAGETPALSVSDSGPGVAPEERALIFDRFQRGRETGGEAGFGLGLAIGRELAQRMGGTLVLVDTEGPGATFTLTLRAAQAPAPDSLAGTAGV